AVRISSHGSVSGERHGISQEDQASATDSIALLRLSGRRHKYGDVRCVAFGFGLGATREHIRHGSATEEQQRPKPKATQPSGRQSFLPQASLLAPLRPLKGMVVARVSPAPNRP